MDNTRRHILQAAAAGIVACGNTKAFSRVIAQDQAAFVPPVRIDVDATLHIPALTTIPPSEFWSAEFKQAYVRSVSEEQRWPTSPAVTAEKSEWNEFDAASDRLLARYLSGAQEHYPVDVLDTHLGGVRVGRITPKGGVAPENKHRILINVHGGGFYLGRGLVMGQIESIPIASIGRVEVVTLDYRQMPYNGFPAGTEDAKAVYRELLKYYQPEAIGIFGTSAGGVLTAQALAAFQVERLPRPGAAGLFWAGPGPFWDPVFTKQGDSMMWPRMFTGGRPPSAIRPAGFEYMRGADPNDPAANPESSDAALMKFPPVLFVTGTRALDMSPAIVAHARLLKLGVDSSLYVMEGGWHGADLFAPGTREQCDIENFKATWFDRHLAR